MNLYLRLLIVIFHALFGEKITDTTRPGRIRLRCYPNDLDSNLHMNNGRYLTIMDLGRFNMIMRSGILKLMIRKKYAPVLGSIQMRFRMPIMPFQLFDLETRVLCWDEKWVYMEQRFLFTAGDKAGAVAAIGLVKGGFFDPATKTTVPTADLMRAMGMKNESPTFPDYLNDWTRAEESLRLQTAQ